MSIAAPAAASPKVTGTRRWRFFCRRWKKGCGSTWTVRIRSPAGAPRSPGSPCPASRSFFPSSIPGGILTERISGTPGPRATDNLNVSAEHRGGKRDRHLVGQIGPFAAALARPFAGAGAALKLVEEGGEPAGRFGSKAFAEKLAEINVLEPWSAGRSPCPSARPGSPTCPPSGSAGPHGLEGAAVPIVHLPLLRVIEDVEGRLNLLKPLFGGLVVGIHVGVIFPRQVAIGLLDLGLRRTAWNPQHLVVILGHGFAVIRLLPPPARRSPLGILNGHFPREKRGWGQGLVLQRLFRFATPSPACGLAAAFVT